MFEQSRPRLRHGSVAVQTILVFSALGIGLLLGRVLLVPSPSSTAPEPAEIITQISQPTLTEAPRSPVADSGKLEVVNEQLAAQVVELKQQMAALESRLAARREAGRQEAAPELRSEQGGKPPRSAVKSSRRSSPAVTGEQTLAYWNDLNRIMLEEEQMRAVPAGGLTAANVAEFLSGRGQSGDYAADAIRELSTDGVDADVVALARDIAAWYDKGTKLNDMATFLLNEADPSSRRGAPGKRWSTAEKEHHQSVTSLNRRGDQLRAKLTEKYKLEFPDLR